MFQCSVLSRARGAKFALFSKLLTLCGAPPWHVSWFIATGWLVNAADDRRGNVVDL